MAGHMRPSHHLRVADRGPAGTDRVEEVAGMEAGVDAAHQFPLLGHVASQPLGLDLQPIVAHLHRALASFEPHRADTEFRVPSRAAVAEWMLHEIEHGGDTIGVTAADARRPRLILHRQRVVG